MDSKDNKLLGEFRRCYLTDRRTVASCLIVRRPLVSFRLGHRTDRDVVDAIATAEKDEFVGELVQNRELLIRRVRQCVGH